MSHIAAVAPTRSNCSLVLHATAASHKIAAAMDDDDEFEREAALDAEDAAWENSDDDASELHRAVTRVQAIVRCQQTRSQYLRLKHAAIHIQGELRERKAAAAVAVQVQGPREGERSDNFGMPKGTMF